MATGLENLWVYTLAENLEIEVHELTKLFPHDELYRSVDQLRRSSASVANNLAESYHKTTQKEKVRFVHIAMGEAEETKRGLIKALRKELLPEKGKGDIRPLITITRYTVLLKGLNAYRKFLEVGQTKTKNH